MSPRRRDQVSSYRAEEETIETDEGRLNCIKVHNSVQQEKITENFKTGLEKSLWKVKG